MESPRGVNDPWLHAAKGCLSKADLVLLLGKKLDFSLRFGRPPAFSPQCRFIQVGDDADQIGDETRVALTVRGDPPVVVSQLTEAAQDWPQQHRSWGAEVAAARNTTPAEWEQLRCSSQRPIHPLRVCAAVQPFLDDGAVLVCDGGEFGQWAQAGLEAGCRLINGLSGGIGSALPLAVAGKLACPQRNVFAVLGDGTFGFHALELDTALRYRLPIIAIVGNDACWNAEYQLQLQRYGAERAVGCDLLFSRYDKVAEALGGHGKYVEDPDELTPALRRAVESGLPACVNVIIDGVAAPVSQLRDH